MCEQCSAKTKTYGEVIPHWWLVQATQDGNKMKKEDFGLVYLNDPDFIFPEELAPRKDPAFGFTKEQFFSMSEEEDEKWFSFQAYVENLTKHFTCEPMVGYELVMDAIKEGCDPKGCSTFMNWLSHKMAETIERNPEAKEVITNEMPSM